MIHIIQWMPYYPPHQGGLETHGQERAQHRVAANYGEVISIVSSIKQESRAHGSKQHQAMKNNFISFENHVIGYMDQGTEVLVVPAFDIISGFPVLRTWSKDYRRIKRYLEHKLSTERHTDKIIVQTRTRFFLSALLGGLRARHRKLPRVHIEHGSGFVKLSSKFSTAIAWLYDQTIGRWIFRHAKVISISQAVDRFVHRFTKQQTPIITRGLTIPSDLPELENLHQRFADKTIIGYVGRLYKWKNVASLIQAYYNLDVKFRQSTQLVIVGNGEDLQKLQDLDTEHLVYFTGGKTALEALGYQRQFDIHVHSSSQGGGLATTLLQAIFFNLRIVATPYEGADEVITDDVNGVLLQDDSVAELQRGIEAALQLDTSTIARYARANSDLIDERFGWASTMQEYKEFYQGLERGKRRK